MVKSADQSHLATPQRLVRQALASATPAVTLKQASRAIGMNDAYLQQFLERGTPRELPERVRYKLADFLGISQDKLNPDPWQRDIHGARPVDPQIRAVPFIDIQASAGAGSVIDAVEVHDIEQ